VVGQLFGRAHMVEVAVGENDGLGVGARIEQLIGGGENGFLAAGQAGINQHSFVGGAGFDEVNIDEALNAQLRDAGG
jgi:hypothetical protein